VSGLFTFPDPVNETSARLVAGAVAVLAVVTVAFHQPWLLAVLAYGFVARALTGPTLSPLGLVVTRVVTPRLRIRHRYSPGPAKRFAQAVGAVVTTSAALLYYVAGLHTLAYVLVGSIFVFATLEAALGLCVGCKMFQLLMRLRIVPPDVCAHCVDVWARERA
jgi:Domain of unknown function (DUF4395)